jgi:hypothetical protein
MKGLSCTMKMLDDHYTDLTMKETLQRIRRLEETMALAAEAGQSVAELRQEYAELKRHIKYLTMRHRLL